MIVHVGEYIIDFDNELNWVWLNNFELRCICAKVFIENNCFILSRAQSKWHRCHII